MYTIRLQNTDNDKEQVMVRLPLGSRRPASLMVRPHYLRHRQSCFFEDDTTHKKTNKQKNERSVQSLHRAGWPWIPLGA